MATTVLSKSRFQVPFLSDKLTVVRGLDPLGRQITSESTYGLLLPGLTNVTHRIRYYGFYCWLLDQYAQQVGETDPKRQQNYVRRAELLVALLIRLRGNKPLHIPGSAFADLMIANNTGGDYKLDQGADTQPGGNMGTYWKYRMGAFGQYYAGSMRVLGLIGTSVHNDQLFVRTHETPDWVSGQELAEAFADSIPKDIQKLFLSSVQSGRLRRDMVKQLVGYFDLSRIEHGGTEQATYLKMLTAPDFPALESDTPTYHRATSLRLALTYLNEGKNRTWEGFLVDNYLAAGEGDDLLTLRGWYYYQLNEYWQVACGSVLAALLRVLEKQAGGYAHVPTFLVELTHQIVIRLQQLLPDLATDSSVGAALTAVDTSGLNEEEYADACQESADDKRPVDQAAAGFALIWKIYQRNRAHLPQLQQYGKAHGLLREGNFIGYAQQLEDKLECSVGEYIHDFLYREIVVRHQYVAMRKMGAGQQSTLKFEIEGEWFRRLDTIQARFSGPRLDVLLQMAVDLSLLDEHNVLTDHGRTLIA